VAAIIRFIVSAIGTPIPNDVTTSPVISTPSPPVLSV
jgi:hypothetical protein